MTTRDQYPSFGQRQNEYRSRASRGAVPEPVPQAREEPSERQEKNPLLSMIKDITNIMTGQPSADNPERRDLDGFLERIPDAGVAEGNGRLELWARDLIRLLRNSEPGRPTSKPLNLKEVWEEMLKSLADIRSRLQTLEFNSRSCIPEFADLAVECIEHINPFLDSMLVLIKDRAQPNDPAVNGLPEERNEGATPWNILRTLSRETLDNMRACPPRLLAFIDLMQRAVREVGYWRRDSDKWRDKYVAGTLETKTNENRDQRTMELTAEVDNLKREMEELRTQLEQKGQQLAEVVCVQ